MFFVFFEESHCNRERSAYTGLAPYQVVYPLIWIFLLQVLLGGVVLWSRKQGILLLELQLRLAKVAILGHVWGACEVCVPQFHLYGLGLLYRISMEFWFVC